MIEFSKYYFSSKLIFVHIGTTHSEFDQKTLFVVIIVIHIKFLIKFITMIFLNFTTSDYHSLHFSYQVFPYLINMKPISYTYHVIRFTHMVIRLKLTSDYHYYLFLIDVQNSEIFKILVSHLYFLHSKTF